MNEADQNFTEQSKWLVEQIAPKNQEYVRDYLVKQVIDTLSFMKDGRFDKAGYIAAIEEWEAKAIEATAKK